MYTNCCKQNNLNQSIILINNIYENGYSVIDIIDSYYSFVKITDILTDDEKYKIIKIICKYIIKFNYLHEHKIELIFLTNNIIELLHNNK
jgi:hypothetical protein